ncbi:MULTISPECIES: hypothetical protein [unclassified Lonepinella]|uniref:hypothetical protein n=1 Tax=unclassified Lonepinella TaxID=2642006 RepID=UPI0036DDC998
MPITLPPRKYYTLPQAVAELNKDKKINVTIEDLIHYASNHLLMLCVKVRTNQEEHRLEFDFIENNQTLDCGFFGDVINISINNDILFYQREINSEQIKNANELMLTIFDEENYFILNGFIGVYPNSHKFGTFERDLLNNEISLNNISLITPREIETNLIIQFDLGTLENIKQKINYNDLYILATELELLKNGGKLLDDYAENSLLTIQQAPQTNRQNVKQENQINFIKTLLFMDYGIETAEQARNTIRNGNLGRKLEKLKQQQPEKINDLNLKIITEKTLFNWYQNS